MDPGVSGPRPGAGSMAMPWESGPQVPLPVPLPVPWPWVGHWPPVLLHQLDYRGV